MRITLITETYTPEINGVAKTLSRLVEELQKRQHTLHIIRPRQKGDEAASTQANGTECTLVSGFPIPGYSGLQFGLPSPMKLRSMWSQQRPDVIYVATEGPLGWSAIKAANKLNIPVVSGFHTNFDAYSKHYRLGFLKTFIFSYLKYLHNKTRCTLAPSMQMVENLEQRGIKNTYLFSRGVDTQVYSPAHRDSDLRGQWKETDDDFIVLYVGRIAAEKNIHTVIAAYDAMRTVNAHIRLVMVGDGPLLTSLSTQREDIIFTGAKIGEELSKHYASADIFLFASETETFGNVVVEAMSSGLAVVGYDYAAANMHIKNKKNGISVTFSDSDAFVQSCKELIVNKPLIQEIQLAARKTAEAIDWAQVIDSFEKRLMSYVNPEQHKQSNAKPQTVSADGSI